MLASLTSYAPMPNDIMNPFHELDEPWEDVWSDEANPSPTHPPTVQPLDAVSQVKDIDGDSLQANQLSVDTVIIPAAPATSAPTAQAPVTSDLLPQRVGNLSDFVGPSTPPSLLEDTLNDTTSLARTGLDIESRLSSMHYSLEASCLGHNAVIGARYIRDVCCFGSSAAYAVPLT